VTRDDTLAGYLEVHERPPAFTGPDGAAYTVGLFVDETANPDGTFGGALVFVRWSDAGDHAIGHVETPCVVSAASPEAASQALGALTLHEVKAHLDRVVGADTPGAGW